MASTRQTGARGEDLAAAYLERAGYELLAQNWHWAEGEIDIVARKDDVLVFVEVRTRHQANTEPAFASISPRKQSRMVKSAYAYLEAQGWDDVVWRIDVIAVALRRGQPIIDHVEDALDW